jgi:hypothetical protein
MKTKIAKSVRYLMDEAGPNVTNAFRTTCTSMLSQS